MKDNVLIYRNQLFKISESFITNQAKHLRSFRPLYVGRKIFGVLQDNSCVISMDEASKLENLKYVLFRDVSYLYQKAHDLNPRLIHAHFGVEGVYAMKLARKLDIPLVVTFHGFDATTTARSLLLSGKPAWINYLLYRKKLAKEGNLFLCVSEFIRRKVLELGFPEERTVTHYTGIDLTIEDGEAEKDDKEFDYVLHVARLTEKKGTEYLIKAWAKICRTYPNIMLVIIGEGPLREELGNLVDALGISNNVLFKGALPHREVLSWMKNADIFCLPSITAASGDAEGLGMVFLEAAKYKVPIVATRHGGIPEAVEDGMGGFLVAERDADALAEKIDLLLKDDELRKKMGEAARRYVERNFDIRKQTKKLEEHYRRLIS